MVLLANAGRDFFLMNFESKETVEIRPIVPNSFYERAAKEMNISVLYEESLSLNRYIDYGEYRTICGKRCAKKI